MCLDFNCNFIWVRRRDFHIHVLIHSLWYRPLRSHTKIRISEGNDVFWLDVPVAEDGMASLEVAERAVMERTGTCCPPQREIATFALLSLFFQPWKRRKYFLNRMK